MADRNIYGSSDNPFLRILEGVGTLVLPPVLQELQGLFQRSVVDKLPFSRSGKKREAMMRAIEMLQSPLETQTDSFTPRRPDIRDTPFGGVPVPDEGTIGMLAGLSGVGKQQGGNGVEPEEYIRNAFRGLSEAGFDDMEALDRVIKLASVALVPESRVRLENVKKEREAIRASQAGSKIEEGKLGLAREAQASEDAYRMASLEGQSMYRKLQRDLANITDATERKKIELGFRADLSDKYDKFVKGELALLRSDMMRKKLDDDEQRDAIANFKPSETFEEFLHRISGGEMGEAAKVSTGSSDRDKALQSLIKSYKKDPNNYLKRKDVIAYMSKFGIKPEEVKSGAK